MREAKYPKEGYRFKYKTCEGSYPLVLFLAEGESLDDYEQITEAEYEAIQTEQEAAELAEMGMIEE